MSNQSVPVVQIDRQRQLIKLVGDEQRRFMVKPSYQEVVKVEDFNPVRSTGKELTADRFGPFSKSLVY